MSKKSLQYSRILILLRTCKEVPEEGFVDAMSKHVYFHKSALTFQTLLPKLVLIKCQSQDIICWTSNFFQSLV